MIYLRQNATGATACTDGIGYEIGDEQDQWSVVEVEVPEGVPPERLHLVGDDLVELPVRLSYDDVVALFTAAEVARIYAAPQLQVTQLLLALRQFGVVLGSTAHQQGTALVAGLGLFDGPDRAARFLAGEKPE